uniref:Uncharacterized protein n=1 Tax=Plectus sambesii TaxID=2011161 RepID=A0A914VMN7_9BILA
MDVTISRYTCCCGAAHCKTGARIVGYAEVVALTSQLSYLAARCIVDGYSFAIFLGVIVGIVETILVVTFLHGIDKEKRSYVLVNLIALSFCLSLAAVHLVTVLFACLFDISSLRSLRRTAYLRIALSGLGSLTLIICIKIVYRFYCFIGYVKAIRSQPVAESSLDLVKWQAYDGGEFPRPLSIDEMQSLASDGDFSQIKHRSIYEIIEAIDEQSESD